MATTQRRKRDGGQDKLQAALQTLERGVEAITGSEEFRRYLSVMARFHHYSANNVMLILMQRPDATVIAGYRRWQQLGRQVRKGEKGLMILAPVVRKAGDEQDETARVVSGFRVMHVWDLAQTDGTPLPEPPKAQLLERGTDTGLWLWDQLSGWLISQGVTVEIGDLNGPLGIYHRATFAVTIERGLLGTDQATKVLAHECAHHVARHTGATSREDAETVAEAAAFAVLDHYGIDTCGYSVPYVAGWAKDVAVLRRNLAAVQNVAHTVIEALENSQRPAQILSEVAETAVDAP